MKNLFTDSTIAKNTIANLIEKLVTDLDIKYKVTVFLGDNCNTNFGGLQRKGTTNVFALLKKRLNPGLIGIGCPVHILHNAVSHGLDQFDLFDFDSIVLKFFNHFKIYTVRIEELKDFCEFVEINYRELLNHSKSRFLSLFPAVHCVLQMFKPLKS